MVIIMSVYIYLYFTTVTLRIKDTGLCVGVLREELFVMFNLYVYILGVINAPVSRVNVVYAVHYLKSYSHQYPHNLVWAMKVDPTTGLEKYVSLEELEEIARHE